MLSVWSHYQTRYFSMGCLVEIYKVSIEAFDAQSVEFPIRFDLWNQYYVLTQVHAR